MFATTPRETICGLVKGGVEGGGGLKEKKRRRIGAVAHIITTRVTKAGGML